MAVITPPTIAALPAAPDPNDRATFNARAYPWATALATNVTQHNALASNVAANATDAATNATTAAANAVIAADQAAIATAAAASAGAVLWVTGTTYAEGYLVYSPVNFLNYRRKTAGAGSVDPSLDDANWQTLSAAPIPAVSDLSIPAESLITLASSLGNNLEGLSAVALDADRELLVLQGSSSVHAIVHDKVSNTFGAPTLLRTAASARAKAALVSADKVLVCTLPNSTAAMASVVLTITGTSITVGTPVATTLAGNSSMNEADKLFPLGSAWVLEYTNVAGVGCLRAITVSGATPAVGAELVLSGFEGGPSFAVTSSVALCVRASNTVLYAIPVSLSGATLTAGTEATTTITARQGVCGVALSGGRYAVTYTNSGVWGAVISISGTTATLSAVNLGMSAGTATDRALLAVGNQAIAGATDGSNVLTDSAGTAVAGTAISSGSGVAFGYTASTLLVNATTSGRYAAIGISGNNPAINYVSKFGFDTAATLSSFPGWRQGNPQLGHLTLRTSAGKHIAVGPEAPPFTLAATAGSIPARCWLISPGTSVYKGVSEAYVWGTTLMTGNSILIRKVEAA